MDFREVRDLFVRPTALINRDVGNPYTNSSQ
jgi:hypothetical protein